MPAPALGISPSSHAGAGTAWLAAALPWERASMGSRWDMGARPRLGLWDVRDGPRHEPQARVHSLEVRNASQHRFCPLKLWLGFVALGAIGEKLPKHEQAARPTGKGGEAVAQQKGRVQPQGKGWRGPGMGCRCTGMRLGCPGSGCRTQPRLLSWRQPWGQPCFVDIHQAARGRATELLREGTRVCMLLSWSVAFLLTQARLRVLRHWETPSPPASGPPVPPQLSPVSFGGLQHHWLHLCFWMGSPIHALSCWDLPALPAPKAGRQDPQHWLWVCVGGGMDISPVQRAKSAEPWQVSHLASQYQFSAGTAMLSAPCDLGDAGLAWVWCCDGARLPQSL